VRQTGHVNVTLPFAHGNHSPDLTFNQSVRSDFTEINSNMQQVGKFKVDQWAYNEARTLRMQQEVFNEIREFAAKAGYVGRDDKGNPEYFFEEWSDLAGDGSARIGLPDQDYDGQDVDSYGTRLIEYQAANNTGVLQKFNAYNEEAEGNSFEGKIQILNDWLEENAYSPIPTYNKSQAASNREKNLADLEQKDVPGVILN